MSYRHVCKYGSYFLYDTPFISGYTTRFGGVSSGSFKSFNFFCGKGDLPENVDSNFSILKERLNFNGPHILPSQEHGNNVFHMKENISSNIITGFDGIFTSVKDILIGVLCADCLPLLIYGNAHCAILHSGWRGTLSKIASKSIGYFIGCGEEPGSLTAIIGPHIQIDNYEISIEIVNEFLSRGFSEKVFQKRGDRYLLSLNNAVLEDLNNAGVKKIITLSEDTFTQKEKFFSYRRDGKYCGEMLNFFIL